MMLILSILLVVLMGARVFSLPFFQPSPNILTNMENGVFINSSIRPSAYLYKVGRFLCKYTSATIENSV